MGQWLASTLVHNINKTTNLSVSVSLRWRYRHSTNMHRLHISEFRVDQIFSFGCYFRHNISPELSVLGKCIFNFIHRLMLMQTVVHYIGYVNFDDLRSSMHMLLCASIRKRSWKSYNLALRIPIHVYTVHGLIWKVPSCQFHMTGWWSTCRQIAAGPTWR